VGLEGEGAVQGHQGAGELADPVRGVPRLVPHQAEVGIEPGGVVEGGESLAESAKLHQRRTPERRGQGVFSELARGPLAQSERFVMTPGVAEQRKVFDPRLLQIGIRHQERLVRGLGLFDPALLQQTTRPREQPVRRCTGEDPELIGRVHGANVPRGARSARAAASGRIDATAAVSAESGRWPLAVGHWLLTFTLQPIAHSP
jgi:hypothetical protein